MANNIESRSDTTALPNPILYFEWSAHMAIDFEFRGYVCMEDVDYVSSWMPEPSLVINTVIIASIAATSPAIINVIKAATKNIMKKITSSRKKKNDNETQSQRGGRPPRKICQAIF